jgi:hypothetical protein
LPKYVRKKGGGGGSTSQGVYLDARRLIDSVNNWIAAGRNVTLKAESTGYIVHEISEVQYRIGRSVIYFEDFLKMETRSYTLQSGINMFFKTESRYGLWNPSWEKVDGHLGAMKKRDQSIKANARESALYDTGKK